MTKATQARLGDLDDLDAGTRAVVWGVVRSLTTMLWVALAASVVLTALLLLLTDAALSAVSPTLLVLAAAGEWQCSRLARPPRRTTGW